MSLKITHVFRYISINNLQFGKNLIVFNFIFNINTNILFISFTLLI